MMKCFNEILTMDIGTRSFLFSIVFQVCGALILLLDSFRSSKKQVPTAYFEGDNTGKINDEDYVELEKNVVAKLLRKIYYNRISFFYLVIGYTLTIWADMGTYSSRQMFVYVVYCSIAVLFLSCLFLYILSKIFAVYRSKVKWKDLESGTTVDVKVGESVTNDGIPAIHVERRMKE